MTAPGITSGMVTERLIVEAVRAGVLLIAESDRLYFKALRPLPPDLADQIKAHRTALMALLSGPGADATPTADKATGPDDGKSLGTSVVSERGKALGCEEELEMLTRAGTKPADMPLMTVVKDAFADIEATVVSVEAVHGRGDKTRRGIRRRAADLIRRARTRNTGDAVAMRDAWVERLAVCTIDNGLPDGHAEVIALGELEKCFAAR